MIKYSNPQLYRIFKSLPYQEQVKTLYPIYQRERINDSINRANLEIRDTIKDSTNVICGTLEKGFDALGKEIQENRKVLEEIYVALDTKLQIIIEQQRVTNVLLSNLNILLKIPDIQKERQYYLEQGLKFFANAESDTSFYSDSLENLLKAEEIEKTDYFTLQKIGLIHLYSEKHLDYNKAIAYFTKSAKYSLGESHTQSYRTTNYLNEKDTKEDLSKLEITVDDIKDFTARTYYYISECYNRQNDYSSAMEYSKKAFEQDADFLVAQFNIAKYACYLNTMEDFAVKNLSEVIQKNRFFSVLTVAEPAMAGKAYINALLNRLKEDVMNQLRSKLFTVKAYRTDRTDALNLIQSIENKYNKNTYLDSLSGWEDINKTYPWNIDAIDYEDDLREEIYNHVDTRLTALADNNNFENVLENTLQVSKSDLKTYSLRAIKYPEIKNRTYTITLENFLDTHTKLLEQHKQFALGMEKIDAFVNEQIQEEHSYRKGSAWVAAIISFLVFNILLAPIYLFAVMLALTPVWIILFVVYKNNNETAYNIMGIVMFVAILAFWAYSIYYSIKIIRESTTTKNAITGIFRTIGGLFKKRKK